MSKHLVIVESPAKAKTIEKYLGSDYSVMACYGHVRDLPSENMGVDMTTFEPTYEVLADKKKLISDIKKKAKGADCIWLATDPDREGEAIAWHVQHSINVPQEKLKRIVFNEITKSAVLAAIERPRSINLALVNAQQARRILDRVVGYEMSPILWKKLKRGLSAGRVQSVAVRLIVEKEKEIMAFEVSDSYKVTAIFESNGHAMDAEYSKEFAKKEDAHAFLTNLDGVTYAIESIDQKESKRSPRAPFTTSSLQQEASSRLGYSVSKTMTLAQRLYEAGHITYMRTDGTTLSDDAKKGIHAWINQRHSSSYLCNRDYQTKVKGAQEAHEAIRPTNVQMTEAGKDEGEQRLYKLIWQRTVASQMADAKLKKTVVKVPALEGWFEIKGEVVSFDGFLAVYPTSTKDKVLPPVEQGQLLQETSVIARQKFTKPPARFTEASLVKKMEELGIGRPSTYAPTITTIQKREYVERIEDEGKRRDVVVLKRDAGHIHDLCEDEGYGNDKGKLQPTDIGTLVTDYLVGHFDRVMSYQFTAEIEAEFDAILTDNLDWTDMLQRFYKQFHPKIESAANDDDRINEERHLGEDPKTGKPVYSKIGRYGPFVQLGENEDESKRSVSLKKGLKYSTLTFEEAMECLAYPIELGDYNGELVTINIGRYGIYIKHGDKNYSMKSKAINDLDDAIELIQEIDAERASRDIQRFTHENEELNVLNGRYGPYISYNKKNYKIPKDKDPKTLTLDDCLTIISEAPKKKKKQAKKK
ncbi:MAG: type I DNA topoisomerase [Candidatus Margulisbacteria bacterium]|nr:type I DNA topoisomerase [Candidatus Margulisiibacteriota bacterium]